MAPWYIVKSIKLLYDLYNSSPFGLKHTNMKKQQHINTEERGVRSRGVKMGVRPCLYYHVLKHFK